MRRPFATSSGPAPSPRLSVETPEADRVASAVENWRLKSTVDRIVSRPPRRALWTGYALGVGTVCIATAFVLALCWTRPTVSWSQLIALLVLLAMYVVAYRLEFQASAGGMVPTQPVLVAMLVIGPVELVPAAVLLAILLAGFRGPRADAGLYGRAVQVFPAWHSAAPAAVLLAFGVRHPSWGDWAVLLLALVAQFALDAATASIRMASLGMAVRTLVPQLGWTFGVDTLMAVIGVGLMLSVQSDWPRVLLAALPVVLVGVLGHDRRRQVEATLSLGAAYDSVSAEATHDAMTGLANRRGWDNSMQAAAELVEADPATQAFVVAADLDGLKHTNDTFGHETGDELIVAFSRLLADLAPPGAVAARLGGDEFGLLVVTDEALVGEFLVSRVRAALAVHEPIRGLRLSASLGWAACPPAPDVTTAMRAADDAAGLDKQLRRANRRTDPPR